MSNDLASLLMREATVLPLEEIGSAAWFCGVGASTMRETKMPVLSTFFGIVIRMFYRDHGPPHFHAEYQGQQATFTFDGEVVAGGLSRAAQRLVKEWCPAHRDDLGANWRRMTASEPLERIAPLD